MAHHDWTPNPIKRSGCCLLFLFLRGQPSEEKEKKNPKYNSCYFTERERGKKPSCTFNRSFCNTGNSRKGRFLVFRLQEYLFPCKHTPNLGARGPNIPLPEALFQSYEHRRCCDGNSREDSSALPCFLRKKQGKAPHPMMHQSETTAPDEAPKRVCREGRQHLKGSRARASFSHTSF